MRSIRVLHLVQFLRAYGAERQVLDLLPYLQAEGITVAAVSVYTSRLTDEERERLPFPSFEIGRKSRADYSFFPGLIREIRQFAPDIVHTHTHFGKYWGRISAWLAGVKTVVFTEHNPCDPRRNRIERFVDPLLHARTARIVTFMEDQRRVLSRSDRVRIDKISVIPNGLPRVDPESSPAARAKGRTLLGVTDQEIAVLVVGRLEYQKNAALAIRTIAASPVAKRKAIRLILVGTGSHEESLRATARALQIEEHVRFMGHRTDVPDLLAGADLLLMTSLFEGMPLSLIEAMNAGVPILTTPWIGASDMLGNGQFGVIASSWTPEDVSQALLRSLANARLRATLAERARLHAMHAFDIRRMARAHRELYETLCPSV